jgi:hypothetical protein
MFRSITVCLRTGRQGLYNDTCTLRQLARNKCISPHIRTLSISVTPKSPPPSSDSGETMKLIVWALSMILPTFLEEVPNLRSLKVDSEEFLRTCCDCIANDLRHEFDRVLRASLSANPDLPFTSTLRSLELNLAAAEDFHLLCDGDETPKFMPLLKNLEHLALRMYDRSGPDGQRHYYSTLSTIQKKHPNTLFPRSLVPMLPRPPASAQLQSLHIKCTHIFDLDGLVRCGKLRGLKEIKLERVKLRASTLIACISKGLTTVDLRDVQLKAGGDGTWHQVFQSLLPSESETEETSAGRNLTHLNIASVGYMPESRFHSPIMAMPEDPNPIPVEGRNIDDLRALERLKKEVVEVNRKRLGVVGRPIKAEDTAM